ncbi:restriction endonuclease subunit S [Vibrio campbellii]|uniref:Restriction endonuclease subunit S n=1 Tax=Vibrio campbellii TaxID=680 RepID=A0ACC7RA40_9VIBR
MSWPLIALGDLCHMVTKGTTPTSIGYDFASEGIPFLRIQNLRDNSVNLDDVLYIASTTHQALKRSTIKAGDVLITIAGTIGRTAIVPSDFPECNCNQAVAIIRFDIERLYPLYLLHWLNSIDARAQISGKKVTATISNLSLGQIKNLKIPLPPLETQKQIAAVLEKADQLRKDCQQMEQELNGLAQSVFIDMFGDPVTNPKGWDKAPLSAIVDEFLGGKSLVAADDQNTEYKNRVLKISAVTSGEFKPRESKPLPNDYEPQVEHFVKAGDLLFSRANTTELVGATTMVFDEHTGLVLPDKLWRFVWKDEKSLSPVFIWQQLCETGVRKEISKLSSGSGGSMKNISKGKLNTLQIIFPPLELQQKFERIYLKLRVELSNNQQQIKFADQAFNSLMQKAFKGELNL